MLGLLLVVGYVVLGHGWSQTPTPEVLPQSSSGSATEDLAAKAVSKPPSTAPQKPRWTFDAQRDRNDHSLSQEQCTQTFPNLYAEIDRAVGFWRARQGDKKLSPEQVDLGWSGDGGLKGMIYEGQVGHAAEVQYVWPLSLTVKQLYVTYSRGLNHFLHWKERSHATLHQIHRALLAAPEPVPNIEFSIKINDVIDLCQDCPDTTVWAFSRNIADPVMEQVWIIPDFNFWSYPRVAGSYGDFQRQAIDEDNDSFEAKKDLLVWRGTTSFNPDLRNPLIQQTQGQSWSDVRRLDEDTSDADQARYRITMPDHCRYKYAVHTEGTTWSGRLKYLLSCHSAIFIHRLTWHTHLYHLLTPSGPAQNYVQVENDWSDLPGKMTELIADPRLAKRIADNAAKNFRDLYFTPAAQTCYWRRLFQTWSEMTYELDPWNYTKLADGTMQKSVKGMTYEEYV